MSRHLSEQEIVDALDGVVSAPLRAHLDECAACRTQVDELGGIVKDAQMVSLPEPSPLFWDHFSARVRTAVEAERQRPATAFGGWPFRSWRAAWMGACVVAALTVAIGLRLEQRPAVADVDDVHVVVGVVAGR